MQLTISGNVPSQKNGKQIAYNQKTKRPFVISNSRVLEWKERAVTELEQQFAGLKVTGYPITIELAFYFDNKRRHDLDNAAAGVMDALVKAGVLEDDNVAFVDRLILRYGGIDKESPRAEIILEE